jgi:hypothetical protein
MSHEVPSILSHPKVQIETKEDILFVRDQLEKTVKTTIELKKRGCGKEMKDSDVVFSKVEEAMTRVVSPKSWFNFFSGLKKFLKWLGPIFK